MNLISAAQFKANTQRDPSWALDLLEPLEITDYCDMSKTKIRHLSPLLHFTGRNSNGDCASFRNCRELENACGTFSGHVDFSGSGIKAIRILHILASNNNGDAASFNGCFHLITATGQYPCFVDFSGSGIEAILDLQILQTIAVGGRVGKKADFRDCPHLQINRVRIGFRAQEVLAEREIIRKLMRQARLQKSDA